MEGMAGYSVIIVMQRYAMESNQQCDLSLDLDATMGEEVRRVTLSRQYSTVKPLLLDVITIIITPSNSLVHLPLEHLPIPLSLLPIPKITPKTDNIITLLHTLQFSPTRSPFNR